MRFRFKNISIIVILFSLLFSKLAIGQCSNLSPSFTASPDTVCGSGANVSFNNNSTGTAANMADYDWYVDGTLFDSTTGLASPSDDNPSLGTHTYMLIGTTQPPSSCTDTAYYTIVVRKMPNADFTPSQTQICQGETIDFNNSSTGTASYSEYLWDFDDGNTSTQNNPSYTYPSDGSYNVTLTVDNGASCVSSFTYGTTIIVNPSPTASIWGDDGDYDTQYCLSSSDTTTIDVVDFYNSTTAAAGNTYDWDFGDGSAIYTTNSEATITHSYTSYGVYEVYMTVTSANGCTNTDHLTVVFEKNVIADFSAPSTTSGCQPIDIQVTNTSQFATLYVWDFGDGTVITTANYTAPAHTYTTPGDYTITLTATNHCNTSSASFSPISVAPLPTAAFTPSTSSGCAPQDISFTNQSSDASPSNNYYWDFDNDSIYDSPGPPQSSPPAWNPPDQTFNFGQYNTLLIARNGCGSDSTYRILVIDTIPDIDLSIFPDTGCTPATFTVINHSFDGMVNGSANYEWWVDGWHSSYAQQYDTTYYTFTCPPGNTPQTHSIRYRIWNHCGSDDTTVYVVVLPEVVARFTASPNPICEGEDITFTQSSYGTNLTYEWDFGNGQTASTAGPHTINYPVAGTYTAQLIVSGDCGIDTLQQTITVNPYPTANIIANPLTICEGESINFSNGGTSGASYWWRFGTGSSPSQLWVENPGAVSYSTAGTPEIILRVTQNSCVAYDTLSITVNPMPHPAFTVNPNSGCEPLDVSFTNNTPNLGGESYSWNFGNGNTSSTPNPSNQIYNTSATAQLIVTTAEGCIDSVEQNITVYPLPIADFSLSDDSVCAEDIISITNNSTGANSYNWDYGNGTSSTESAITHDISYPSHGTDTITLIVASAQNCYDTLQKVVVVDSIPYPDFSATTVCLGDITDFTDLSTGNINAWHWDFGTGNLADSSSLQNPNFTYTTDQTYQVTLTISSPNGCQNDTTKPVIVNPVPIANFSWANTCEGSSTQFTDLTNGNPTAWHWNFGTGNPADTSILQNTNFIFPDTGSYQVQLVVSSGTGCSDTLTQLVYIDSVPIANFTSANVCSNDTVHFQSISTSNPDQLLWIFGDGNSNNTNADQISHIYNTANTYTVNLVATYSSNGCADTATQNIDIYPRTQPNFTFDEVCLHDSTHFVDATTGSPTSWEWNFDDASPHIFTPNSTHLYLTSNTYNVSLITSNSFGCYDTTIQTVHVFDLPTANYETDTVCQGTGTQFSDLSTNATQWDWDFGDGNTSSIQNPNYTYADSGFFNTQLIVSTIHNCKDTLQKTTWVYGNPIAGFWASEECQSYATQFTDTSYNASSWNWNFGDGFTDSIANPQHTYSGSGTYSVNLTVNNVYHCSDTYTSQVNVLNNPTAIIAYQDTCAESFTQFTDASIGTANNWQWDFGDGFTDSIANPQHTYTNSGSYTVKLIVGVGSGCTDTTSINVDIYPIPVPNFNFTSVCKNDTTYFQDISTGTPDIWLWDFGNGQNDLSNSSSTQTIYNNDGNYNVQLIAGYSLTGCQDTITKQVDAFPRTSPNFIADTICLGFPTQFSDATTNNPITWTWDFGDANGISSNPNPQYQYNNDGIYSVSLVTENSYNCIDTIIKDIFVKPLPTSNFTFDTICQNFETSYIDLSTNAVDWTWNFGDGNSVTGIASPTHIFNTNGTFNTELITTNSYSCYDTLVRTVTVWSNPIADFTYNTACHTFASEFTDTSTDAVSWSWNFADGDTSNLQNPSHIYSNDGNYNVQLIAENIHACKDTNNHNITVLPRPVADFNFNNVCAGFPAQFNNTSLGQTNYWTWDFGDGANDNTENPQHIYSVGNTYNVELQVLNNAGCGDTLTQAVQVFSVPNANFSVDTTCFGDITNFTDLSTDALSNINYFYWEFGDANTSYSQNPSYIYQNVGNFTVNFTIQNEHGCRDSISKTVRINPVASTDFTIDQINCPGDILNVNYNGTASSNAQFYWTFENANIVSGINEGPYQLQWNTPGTFIVRLDSVVEFNCTSINPTSYAVPVPQPLNLTLNSSDVLCNVGTDTCTGTAEVSVLGGASPYTFDWSNSISNNSGMISDLCPGNYTVTIHDANGCVNDTFFTVNIPNPLYFTESSGNISCHGLSDGFASVIMQGGTQPYTYSWSNSDTLGTSVGLSAGSYFLTASDANNCFEVFNFNLTEPPTLHIDETHSPVSCFGNNDGQANLVVSGGTPDYIYQWSDGINHGASSNLVAGNYTITVADSHSCETTTSFEITQPSLLDYTPRLQHLTCARAQNGSIGAENTWGGTPPYSYQWNINSSDSLLNNMNPGFYQLTITDAKGCFRVQDFDLKIQPPDLGIIASEPSGCAPLDVNFEEVNINNAISYEWNFGGPDMNNTSFSPTPNETFDTPGAYNVSLTIVDVDSCVYYLSSESLINAWDSPIADFDVNPNFVYISHPTVELTNLSEDAFRTYWLFDNGDTSNVENPTYTFDSTGVHPITLMAINTHGCVDYMTKEVRVQDEYTFFMPNVFSPDNDNINDDFGPVGIGMSEDDFVFRIYDRWGEPIFETNDLHERWDGRYRAKKHSPGEIVQNGIYTWLVRYKDLRNVFHEYTGPVKVMR